MSEQGASVTPEPSESPRSATPGGTPVPRSSMDRAERHVSSSSYALPRSSMHRAESAPTKLQYPNFNSSKRTDQGGAGGGGRGGEEDASVQTLEGRGEGEGGGAGKDGCSPPYRTRWREGAAGELSVEQSWSDTSPLSTLVKVRGLGKLNCTTGIEN